MINEVWKRKVRGGKWVRKQQWILSIQNEQWGERFLNRSQKCFSFLIIGRLTSHCFPCSEIEIKSENRAVRSHRRKQKKSLEWEKWSEMWAVMNKWSSEVWTVRNVNQWQISNEKWAVGPYHRPKQHAYHVKVTCLLLVTYFMVTSVQSKPALSWHFCNLFVAHKNICLE